MTMWVPKRLAGYSGAEIRAMAADDALPRVGVSKWELDTPALCVDLDKLEQNLATMQAKLASRASPARPHAKTHKCPAIAKLSARLGIDRHLHGEGRARRKRSSPPASKDPDDDGERDGEQDPPRDGDPQRESAFHPGGGLCAERARSERRREGSGHRRRRGRRRGGRHAQRHSGRAAGARARPTGRHAAEPEAARHHQLRRRRAAHQRIPDAARAHAERFEPSVGTCDLFARAGLSTEIFSGGGTGTYNIMTRVPGFTDLQVGSYVFMDAQYLEIGGESGDVYTDFVPSLTVITTVLNNDFPGRITTDAGAKALTLNKPDAIVVGEQGFSYNAGSDEFGVIRYETAIEDLQGRRQAGADRAALRSGGERIRPDLRHAQGHGRSRSGRSQHGGIRSRHKTKDTRQETVSFVLCLSSCVLCLSVYRAASVWRRSRASRSRSSGVSSLPKSSASKIGRMSICTPPPNGAFFTQSTASSIDAAWNTQ